MLLLKKLNCLLLLVTACFSLNLKANTTTNVDILSLKHNSVITLKSNGIGKLEYLYNDTNSYFKYSNSRYDEQVLYIFTQNNYTSYLFDGGSSLLRADKLNDVYQYSNKTVSATGLLSELELGHSELTSLHQQLYSDYLQITSEILKLDIESETSGEKIGNFFSLSSNEPQPFPFMVNSVSYTSAASCTSPSYLGYPSQDKCTYDTQVSLALTKLKLATCVAVPSKIFSMVGIISCAEGYRAVEAGETAFITQVSRCNASYKSSTKSYDDCQKGVGDDNGTPGNDGGTPGNGGVAPGGGTPGNGGGTHDNGGGSIPVTGGGGKTGGTGGGGQCEKHYYGSGGKLLYTIIVSC